MLKTLVLVHLSILGSQLLSAQNQLSYLEKPKLSGIHIYQNAANKRCTIVAGSDELLPSPTLIYQLDSNAHIVAAKQIAPCGKNITSAAASNHNRTIIARSVLTSTGQLTANLICLDSRLNIQWSSIVESNHIAFVNAVQIGPLGNTFVVGNGLTRPPSENYSFLCKMDAHGEKAWELVDFPKGDTIAFWRLAVDDHDNAYAVGSMGNKGLLTKITASGDVEWQQSIFYRSETRLSAITASNGFLYVLGAEGGQGKVFLSKLTATGQMVWTTLLSSAYRFSPDHASIKTTEHGEIVLALYYVDPLINQRAWAAVRMDESGKVMQASSYQNNAHESFPRDLFLGKNATMAGIGTLAVVGEPDKYPFFLQSTLPEVLGGQCCFTPFSTTQKSINLELLPATLEFVNQVVINFVDFPLVTKDDAGTIRGLKK